MFKWSSVIIVLAAVILSAPVYVQPAWPQNFANWSPEEEKEAVPDFTVVDPGEPDVDSILERVATAESGPEQPETGPVAGEASRYTLDATDVIEIKVLRHPELSSQYMINQEGKIQYEFVGDIVVSGMTKEEAAKALKEKLAEYIISPEVSVKIIGYNSKVVYVVGEVGSPGKIYMRGDTITVHEALIQAGLPLLTAVTRKSKLITPSQTGKGNIKNIDVYALLYEGDLRQNYDMKPGDVIFIPATFLTKTMRALQPVAAPIGTAASTGRTVVTGF